MDFIKFVYDVTKWRFDRMEIFERWEKSDNLRRLIQMCIKYSVKEKPGQRTKVKWTNSKESKKKKKAENLQLLKI